MNLTVITEILKKTGLRKVTTGIGLYIFNGILLCRKMLTVEGFVELSQWLILAIFAGNALEHYAKGGKKNDAPVKPLEE